MDINLEVILEIAKGLAIFLTPVISFLTIKKYFEGVQEKKAIDQEARLNKDKAEIETLAKKEIITEHTLTNVMETIDKFSNTFEDVGLKIDAANEAVNTMKMEITQIKHAMELGFQNINIELEHERNDRKEDRENIANLQKDIKEIYRKSNNWFANN